MKETIIAIIIIVIIIAISSIFYTTMEPVVWNNGVHTCGGHWVDNGIVMVGRSHSIVNYLYICDNCGTGWTSSTHF